MDARVVACGAASQAALAIPTLMMVGVSPTPGILAATAAYLATRTVLNHYGEVARSNHRIGVYTVAALSAPLAGSGLSIAAAIAFGSDPAIALAAMALGQIGGVVLVMIGLGLRPRLGRFDKEIFAEARQFALPLVFSGLFVWAASNGVRVLVEAGEGIVGVGLFSVGWGLGQRLAFMLAALCNAAAFPLAVDRLEAGDRQGALRHVGLNGAAMIGLMAPATVGVAILSAPLVRLVVAAQFQDATILILPIAMATGVARALRIHIGDQTALLVRRTAIDDDLQLPRRRRHLAGGRCRRAFRRGRRRGGRLPGGNLRRHDGGDDLRLRPAGPARSRLARWRASRSPPRSWARRCASRRRRRRFIRWRSRSSAARRSTRRRSSPFPANASRRPDGVRVRRRAAAGPQARRGGRLGRPLGVRIELSMYSAVTNDIRVAVEPAYSPERSKPEERASFLAYTIEIVNLSRSNGAVDASSLDRITDAAGLSKEVRGPGVVGEQPTLAPGESFRYASGCPLRTPSGVMVGTYRMVAEDGEVFEVAVPAFSLDIPAGAAGAQLRRAGHQFIALRISGLTTLSSASASIGPTSLKAIAPSPLTMKVSGTP